MTRFQRHLPRKVEFARDVIVTWIHDRGLKVGDRLPSYSQLRAEFGLGSQTIAAALGSLCELGMLEVRDKVGIFVKNPTGGHLAGRTVAVLSEYNCRCLTFYQVSDPELVPRPDLSEFPGLEQAAAEHRFDGIITLCPFSEVALRRLNNCGMKCCFIGDDDHNVMPYGVLIEARKFSSMAKDEFVSRGCGRVVQFFASPAQEELRRNLLPGEVGCSYDGGAAIARKFMSLPPANRPDGIVSDDDTIVSGFLAELISSQTDSPTSYLPLIATIIHEEIGERYPSNRMLIYAQNMETYARMAVDLLLRLLQGRHVENPVAFYRFRPQFAPHKA